MEFELSAFLASPAGLAVKGALVAAFADFAVGSFFALQRDTFALDSVAAFARKHLLGRVAPLAALLAAGYAAEDTALTGAAVIGLTAYAAETFASIKGSIFPPTDTETVEVRAEAMGDPVPQD
jgi:hypothetical protein